MKPLISLTVMTALLLPPSPAYAQQTLAADDTDGGDRHGRRRQAGIASA